MSEFPPAEFEDYQNDEDTTLLHNAPLDFADDDFHKWLTFFGDALETDDTLQATKTQTSSLAISRLLQEDVLVVQEKTDLLASAMTLQDSHLPTEIFDPFVASYKSVTSLVVL